MTTTATILPYRLMWLAGALCLMTTFVLAQPETKKPLHGLDPKNMDLSVKPSKDFYLYANGGWLATNAIPPAFPSWGSFTELAEKNNDVLHEILNEAASNTKATKGSNKQKIGDMFFTGMDSAAIENLGVKPIEPDLKRIVSIQDVAGLQSEIAELHRSGVGAAFNFGSGQDAKNSTTVVGIFNQGGLGLPNRDYYDGQDARSKKIREDYVNHMTAMFKLLGDDAATAEANAKNVMALETRLAKASLTPVENRDPDKTYNKMTQKQLSELAPDFSWDRYFVGLSIPNPGDVVVRQPNFLKEVGMKEVGTMMKEVSLDDWKTYLRWRLVRDAAPALSSAFVNENFRFNSTLTGAKELQPRWKRILQVINGRLGDALGELYVAKNFSPQAKARAKEMVNNLLTAMREHITSLDWMDDATKQLALKKLSTFGVKIGYPDVWRDYSSMKISRDSYFENIKQADEFAFRYNISKIGKPVNRQEWNFTTPTVNASYSATRNEITFPAGILQPPFFDPDADDAVNYGGMGAVIGHEISHGFDDQGSKFDADGNLKDWWTPESRKKFEERANLVVKQFNGYV
ncbi:MAG: M13 family metallopeptidase, partial [Ignavibacteriales bacterium]|nr:M13 family metallopeptidase [Ignavibacteriales bacterium]